MTKLIEFTTTRKIDYLCIIDQFVACKEEKYIDSIIDSKVEGIVEMSQIEGAKSNKGLVHSKYELYKKELLNVHRNEFIFEDYELIQAYSIEKPYSYISENGLEDVVLLDVSEYNHNIYNIDGSICPKAVFFDYISGRVTNENYDLTKALNILKSRSDIVLLSDKDSEETEGDIRTIPYYNASDTSREHITFKWIPSDEDFEKVKDLSIYHFHDKILTDIIGLVKLEKDL